jgi:hypothetical protein
MNTTEFKEDLLSDIEGTVHWRTRKYAEYPDDHRNDDCARSLGQLAEQLSTIPVDDPDLEKLCQLEGDADEDLFVQFKEIISDSLGRYGFNTQEDGDAREFLQDLVRKYQDAIRSHKVDASSAPEWDDSSAPEWDVFISHAWEDKQGFVESLARELRSRGLKVWYDDFTLTVGDSLRRSIDHGLAQSRYGVVILSVSFFAKEWPQKELDGLMAREVGGRKVILPVWHQIDAARIRGYSPTLADKVAVPTSLGAIAVAEALIRGMDTPDHRQPLA